MKLRRKLSVLLFCGCIFTIFILFIALPKRAFSEREKRFLAEKPSLSFDSLVSGEFAQELDSYLADHFPGRTFFVGLNSSLDKLSFLQATKDIYLCNGDRLVERPISADESIISANIEAISCFSEQIPCEVYFGIIPSAGSLMDDTIKGLSEPYPDSELISKIGKKLSSENARYINLDSLFRAQDADELFYKTDHHWTSLGAYKATEEICRVMGCSALPRQAYSVESFDGFRGSTYSRAALWSIPSEALELWDSGEEKHISYLGDETVYNCVFAKENLSSSDMYTVFLNGNQALVDIETPNAEYGDTLLVIRDSFSNSLGCFLSDTFRKTILIDLRYYKDSISELCRAEEVDKILILYGLGNFAEDTNLPALKYESFDPAAEETEEAEVEAEPVLGPPHLDMSGDFFGGSLFLGDSVSAQLSTFTNEKNLLPGAQFACAGSYSVNAVVNKYNVLTHHGVAADAYTVISESSQNKLFVLFYANDLITGELPGRWSADPIIDNYTSMVKAVRELRPDMQIYIESPLSVHRDVRQFSINNANIATLRERLKEFCYNSGCCYVDVASAMMDENGDLKVGYSFDNYVHLTYDALGIWVEELEKSENYCLPEDFSLFPVAYGEIDEADNISSLPSLPSQTAQADEEYPVLTELYRSIEALLPQMTKLSSRRVEDMFGPSREKCDIIVYTANEGIRADEIWLAELTDPEYESELRQFMANRIENRMREYEKYDAEQFAVLKKAEIFRSGKYIALVISPNINEIESILFK